MRTTITQQAGLAAYQTQLQTQRVQEAIYRAAETRQTSDSTDSDASTSSGFRFKLGKLQVSLFEKEASVRDAMQEAMESMRSMEEQAWRAEMDVASLRQEIAAPLQRQAQSASAPQELASSSTPAKHIRNKAANAYASAQTAYQYSAARPGALIGVY